MFGAQLSEGIQASGGEGLLFSAFVVSAFITSGPGVLLVQPLLCAVYCTSGLVVGYSYLWGLGRGPLIERSPGSLICGSSCCLTC